MNKAELRDWAIENDLHPDVHAFLIVFGDMSDHGFIYVDAEGWQAVTAVLRDEELSADDRRSALMAILGGVGAEHFLQHLTLLEKLPTSDADLSGADVSFTPSESAAVVKYFSTTLNEKIAHVKQAWGSDFIETDAFTELKNEIIMTFRFAAKNLTVEYLILFFQTFKSDQSPDVMGEIYEPVAELLAPYAELM